MSNRILIAAAIMARGIATGLQPTGKCKEMPSWSSAKISEVTRLGEFSLSLSLCRIALQGQILKPLRARAGLFDFGANRAGYSLHPSGRTSSMEA